MNNQQLFKQSRCQDNKSIQTEEFKIPQHGSVSCSCTLVSPVFLLHWFQSLCLIGQHGHREALVSSQWQAAFVWIKEKKKDGTKWARGSYLLLANIHCPQW